MSNSISKQNDPDLIMYRLFSVNCDLVYGFHADVRKLGEQRGSLPYLTICGEL